MMSPINGSKVTLRIGDKVVGTMKSFQEKAELRDMEPGEYRVPKYEGTIPLAGATINHEALNRMLGLANPTFDVILRNLAYKPPRKLRSKKNRLRKKWRKKYSQIVDSAVYKNCTITEVM